MTETTIIIKVGTHFTWQTQLKKPETARVECIRASPAGRPEKSEKLVECVYTTGPRKGKEFTTLIHEVEASMKKFHDNAED